MKITFEPGDTVEVEDNAEAGETAACVVELIERVSADKWRVRCLDFVMVSDKVGKTFIVDESYFHAMY
jgi:hypothetical protein